MTTWQYPVRTRLVGQFRLLPPALTHGSLSYDDPRLLLLCVAIIAMAAPARLAEQAQATTGIIRGLVTDDRNAPVASALVTLRTQETTVTRSVRTSDRGIYAAPLLPLGRYEESVRATDQPCVGKAEPVRRASNMRDRYSASC